MDPIPNQLHGQFGSNPEQVYKKRKNIYMEHLDLPQCISLEL